MRNVLWKSVACSALLLFGFYPRIAAAAGDSSVGISVANDNLAMNYSSTTKLATGSQTVTVVSQHSNGYKLSLKIDNDATTDLIHDDNLVTDKFVITSTTNKPLADKTWGYSLTNSTNFSPLSKAAVDLKTTTAPTSASGDSTSIYFGARIDDPMSMRAGDYKTTVEYTVTAELVPPTITRFTPEFYVNGSNENTTMTLYGENFTGVNEVFIDTNNNHQSDTGEQCMNLNVASDTQMTCTIPTNANQGTYDVYAVGPGGSAMKYWNFSYHNDTYRTHYDDKTGIKIDFETNLIPVNIDSSGNVTKADRENVDNSWFDYDKKKWANAVTLNSTDNANKYYNAANGTTINKADIKGYWVYIPRYAYEVMRSDARDKAVPRQSFSIVFENERITTKTPKASCNLGILANNQMWANNIANNAEGNILAKDYRTGCGIDRVYPGSSDEAKASQTTWATHPAFEWGSRKLNGFWYAKFMTTGSRIDPSVLPGQVANSKEAIGNMITINRNIASAYAVDDNNYHTGNNISNAKINTNNLSMMRSHMSKNSEYAAVMYLAQSAFGVGNQGMQKNMAYADNALSYLKDGDNDDGAPITGCGPLDGDERGESAGRYWGSDAGTRCFNRKNGRDHSFYTDSGIKASTTGTRYGVYDMWAHGAIYAMASYSNDANSVTVFWGNQSPGAVLPSKPYIDIFTSNSFPETALAWSIQKGMIHKYLVDRCTWSSCGGQALMETNSVQSIDGDKDSWMSGNGFMVSQYTQWMVRGSGAKSAGGEEFADSPYSTNGRSGSGSRTLNMRAVMITSD